MFSNASSWALPLGVASGKRRAAYYVAAIFVLLMHDFEVHDTSDERISNRF